MCNVSFIGRVGIPDTPWTQGHGGLKHAVSLVWGRDGVAHVSQSTETPGHGQCASASSDSESRVKAPSGIQTPLYVSSCLSFWAAGGMRGLARDVQINDTVYRLLDPEYFAWLRSKMTIAKMAHLAGQLSEEDYEGLRGRFNRVQDWAIGAYGEAALVEASRRLDARRYAPPEPVMLASRERFERPIAVAQAQARVKVEAIMDEAVALGWNADVLVGEDRNREARVATRRPAAVLGECLRAGAEIGRITREAIEIMLPSGVRQHFYNPDVEQPWIRKSK